MITVIGLGFVGLSTAFNFCYLDNKKVYGYDLDKEKIDKLKDNKMYLNEPEFYNMLDSSLNKNFFPVNNLDCIKECDYIFICVNTHQSEDGSADLSCIFASLDSILDNYDKSKYRVIVIKSSVPPTTTKMKIIPYIESKGLIVGKDIGVSNNPEFLREGYCYYDIKNVDRVVIGTNDLKTENKMNDLYKKNNDIIFNVSLNTGEFIKYLSNSMLATMISFSNEMANIAYAIGDIDVSSSFKIIHKDKRWNDCNMKSYVYPGCGYGGYCLPKDTHALYDVALKNGVNSNILKSVIELNENMDEVVVSKITDNIDFDSKIGILGLSFKPNSDDTRNSASYKIIDLLIKKGYKNIFAYDPVASINFKDMYNLDINYINDYEEIINDSDILVILTGWDLFKDIKNKTNKKVIDCRYIL